MDSGGGSIRTAEAEARGAVRHPGRPGQTALGNQAGGLTRRKTTPIKNAINAALIWKMNSSQEEMPDGNHSAYL